MVQVEEKWVPHGLSGLSYYHSHGKPVIITRIIMLIFRKTGHKLIKLIIRKTGLKFILKTVKQINFCV